MKDGRNPSGSGEKRHLSNAIGFIDDFMNTHKIISNNLEDSSCEHSQSDSLQKDTPSPTESIDLQTEGLIKTPASILKSQSSGPLLLQKKQLTPWSIFLSYKLDHANRKIQITVLPQASPLISGSWHLRGSESAKEACLHCWVSCCTSRRNITCTGSNLGFPKCFIWQELSLRKQFCYYEFSLIYVYL